MTAPSALDTLPPGSPEDPHAGHLVSAASATPNFGFLYRPVGLSQREEDALRIHVLLMFYDDHALLWSSLEQHFHGMDEKRLNSAIALLEEVDAVEVEPAPAPNPWSPDDALVRLVPHPLPPPWLRVKEESQDVDRTLPLPWPGSHVYSPVVPATPGPPAFGFPVLLSEGDYHAEQASEYPFPGSVSAGAAAFSSGRPGRRRSGTGSRGGLPAGLTITQAIPGLHGSQTPRSIPATPKAHPIPGGYTSNPSLPTFTDALRNLPMTVTPPSSDRWISEESSPWFGPVTGGEQGWMDKRLGNAMSGVDFLDLDRMSGEGGEERAEKVEEVTAPMKRQSPTTDVAPSLSLGMDDTLDIVKNAIDAANAKKSASVKPDSAESSRLTSKKGRERTGLGVSFAHTDEFHEYPGAEHGSAYDVHGDDEDDDEQGQAKTPIANPAGGWMRRLEKAYSYG